MVRSQPQPIGKEEGRIRGSQISRPTSLSKNGFLLRAALRRDKTARPSTAPHCVHRKSENLSGGYLSILQMIGLFLRLPRESVTFFM